MNQFQPPAKRKSIGTSLGLHLNILSYTTIHPFVFWYFLTKSPWATSLNWKTVPLEFHLKLEFPSAKDALCKVRLKLAKWFNVFHYFIIISPWKKVGPFTWKNYIPITQGYFVSSLVEIGPVVLEKKMKMQKVYRQTKFIGDQKSSLELLAQVSW